MKSKLVHLIGWGTLLGFGGLGLVLNHFINQKPFLHHGYPWQYQLGLGLLYGAISAYVILWFIRIPIIAADCQKYVDLIKPLNITPTSAFFLSLCAGLGEELFFRVALQPTLGIWPCSVIFVAVHGYLNIRRPIFYYGLLMTIIVGGIGYLYRDFGFWSAVAAHFMIDFILFNSLKKFN